jgi:hypothetical protein
LGPVIGKLDLGIQHFDTAKTTFTGMDRPLGVARCDERLVDVWRGPGHALVNSPSPTPSVSEASRRCELSARFGNIQLRQNELGITQSHYNAASKMHAAAGARVTSCAIGGEGTGVKSCSGGSRRAGSSEDRLPSRSCAREVDACNSRIAKLQREERVARVLPAFAPSRNRKIVT